VCQALYFIFFVRGKNPQAGSKVQWLNPSLTDHWFITL